MNDLRTAAALALEALEYGGLLKKRQAITALKAALAEPSRAQQMRDAGYSRRPTLREMAEPAQEPVAFPEGYEPHELPADYTGPLWIEGQVRRLYERTAPPQRKPLTEEEIINIFADVLQVGTFFDVARAIERAHGIK